MNLRMRSLREAMHGITYSVLHLVFPERFASGYTWSYRWYRLREATTLDLATFYAKEEEEEEEEVQ